MVIFFLLIFNAFFFAAEALPAVKFPPVITILRAKPHAIILFITFLFMAYLLSYSAAGVSDGSTLATGVALGSGVDDGATVGVGAGGGV